MGLIQSIQGPPVYRFFLRNGGAIEGRPYVSNKMEDYSNKVLLFGYVAFHVLYNVFPLYAVYYIIRRGFPTVTGVMTTLSGYAFVPVVLSVAYILRGIGRYSNPDYQIFLKAYNEALKVKGKFTAEKAVSTGLGDIDFGFSHYPVRFVYSESDLKPRVLSSSRRLPLTEQLLKIPTYFLSYIGAHALGRRMIYPGSLSIIQKAMETLLSEGRAKLVRKYGGDRAKLVAADGNHIDTMFVDRRQVFHSTDPGRGRKLVICCEGNAAFYEAFGAMNIPLEAGFSVLGWNHPGFAGSSGLPFPSQENNAIDVVVRYAVSELGFSFKDIIIYAWSIGGYTASWAAMSYPDISAIILDATFDEMKPLAVSRVHRWLRSLCEDMVEEHFELNVAEQISHYHGPVQLIRRVRDEMICTNTQDLSSNRINYLLVKLLLARYPKLITNDSLGSLWQWIKCYNYPDRAALLRDKQVNLTWCKGILNAYIRGVSGKLEYPLHIGDDLSSEQKSQLLLYLAESYMENFEAQHCAPLTRQYFKIPEEGNLSFQYS